VQRPVDESNRGLGVVVVVAYKPRPGQEEQLLQLTREHVPLLRREGLATDRPVCAMRAADGTIVEVFEWKSQEAIAAAHQNAAVQALWSRYQEACEYVPLATLPECQQMFAGFVPVAL